MKDDVIVHWYARMRTSDIITRPECVSTDAKETHSKLTSKCGQTVHIQIPQKNSMRSV